MKSRTNPCTECRKYRRKCARPNMDDNAKCDRCERLGKTCRQPTEEEKLIGQYQNDDSVNALQGQIYELESAIQSMEHQIKALEGNTYSSSSSISSSSGGGSTQLTTTSTHYTPEIQQFQDLFRNWKIKIKDGSFVIETGIKTISELLLQSNPLSGYLSPLSMFSSDDDSSSMSSSNSSSDSGGSYVGCGIYRGKSGLVFSFGRDGDNSLIPFAMRLMNRFMEAPPKQRTSNLLLTSPSNSGPNRLINQLIDIYFQCHNIYNPLVHESSYRARIATVEDVTTDIITLSICCYVCCSPCGHLELPAYEIRKLADYFFIKAKAILLDQFDDPEKRLDNVISTNLMSHYTHMTIRFREGRRLASVAQQILLDLRRDFPEYAADDCKEHYECLQHDPSFKKATFSKMPINNADKALYTRHVTITTIFSYFMNYISNDTYYTSPFHLPQWEYLQDEPEKTKRFILTQNYTLKLYNHPFVFNFMQQTHRVHIGQTCVVTFESIVRLEDVISDWITALPQEYSICHIRDMKACKEAINNTWDTIVLKVFIELQTFRLINYSCLIQPTGIEQNADNQTLLMWIQEHAQQESLRCCQLILYAACRLRHTEESDCNYIMLASAFLFQAINVLALLVLSHNQVFATKVRALMKSCLKELQEIRALRDRDVLPCQLPLSSSAITSNIDTLDFEKHIDVSYYDQYPHPWLVMMYDVSQYIVSRH